MRHELRTRKAPIKKSSNGFGFAELKIAVTQHWHLAERMNGKDHERSMLRPNRRTAR
jgi:hypothetical protein